MAVVLIYELASHGNEWEAAATGARRTICRGNLVNEALVLLRVHPVREGSELLQARRAGAARAGEERSEHDLG